MLERLRQLPARLLEFWKKLTTRQKVISISSFAAVVLTLVILIILLSRVQYEPLNTFESTATAKSAMEILSAEGIANKLEADNLTVDVDVTKKQNAVLALAGTEAGDEMTLARLLENDLSTTSNDKMLKNHLYMQSYVSKQLSLLDGVEKASVVYFPADNTNRILAPASEISCSVFLTINESFNTKDTPVSIATSVAYAIGNSTTDKIKIIDQHGNLLFGGEEEDPDVQDLNANLAYKKLVEKLSLKSKAFSSKDLKGLADSENPLNPINRVHCLLKMFLNAHSGFSRDDLQGYLNLYAFVINQPYEPLEKVEKLINLAFERPKLLRYREQFK